MLLLMTIARALLSSVLLFASASLASEAPPTPEQSDAEVPNAGAPTAPVKLLVLSPTAPPDESAAAQAVATVVAVELQKLGPFDVITARDVEKMIELEGEKQAVGCADDSCLAELAGAMGAGLVVFGELTKIGGLRIVQLNLFDSAAAKSIARVSVENRELERLPQDLRPKLAELVDAFIDDDAKAALIAAGAAPTPSSRGEGEGEGGVLPIATLAGGAVIAALSAVALVGGFVPTVLGYLAIQQAQTAIEANDVAGYRAADGQYRLWQSVEPVGLVVSGVGAIGVVVGGAAAIGGGVLFVMGDSE